jgi:ParB family chromosome partitioning protein
MRVMRLEFHQLERRLEHLRVRRPERHRRLLASLAASGQQTPIIVVAAEQADRYLVIDGYQRIAALQQLGRDTVEAVVWSLSEVEALLLDRSMRSGDHDTALEEGWLLAELEQRFGYGLEELARRFDRSTSWVSRRMGLVELLPETVQQQVRDGSIAAQVAMKFLVPVARSRPEDCRRMAEGFARYRWSSREAGQFYAAWRTATQAVRDRLLDEPQLFLKTQRQHAVDPPSPTMVELDRDLEAIVAMARRANRRLSGATVELDMPQCAETHRKIHRVIDELGRLAAKIPHQPISNEQGAEDAEPKSTHGDAGAACAKGEHTRDRAGAEDQPSDGARGAALRFAGSADVISGGDLRTLPAADPGTVAAVQGQSGTCAGGVGSQRSEAVVPGVDRLLPPARNRASANSGGGPLPVLPGRGAAARHLAARGSTGRQAAQGADRLGGAVLLAHAVLPVVSHLPAFRLQGFPGGRLCATSTARPSA